MVDFVSAFVMCQVYIIAENWLLPFICSVVNLTAVFILVKLKPGLVFLYYYWMNVICINGWNLNCIHLTDVVWETDMNVYILV